MSMLVDLYGRSATLPPVELNTGLSDGLVLFSWMFAMLIATSCVTRSWSSRGRTIVRSEEHTSELQSLMRISYAVFCLKKKKKKQIHISAVKLPTNTTTSPVY